jgi:hypothetical protein
MIVTPFAPFFVHISRFSTICMNDNSFFVLWYNKEFITTNVVWYLSCFSHLLKNLPRGIVGGAQTQIYCYAYYLRNILHIQRAGFFVDLFADHGTVPFDRLFFFFTTSMSTPSEATNQKVQSEGGIQNPKAYHCPLFTISPLIRQNCCIITV